jgi:hypothetical protein
MAPVLEITDGHGKLLPFANCQVLATMLHPDDPKARERLVRSVVARGAIEIGVSLPRKLWRLATERSVQTDSLMDVAAAGGAYGMAVAGDLLMMIFSAALYCPENASLARAVRVWCEDKANGRTHGGGRVAASPRAVVAAWARFKPVAHLCAARMLHQDCGEQSNFGSGRTDSAA